MPFDPNKPYETVSGGNSPAQRGFDPRRPYERVQPMSTGEDVWRSAVTGLVEGTTALAGTRRDLADLVRRGLEYLGVQRPNSQAEELAMRLVLGPSSAELNEGIQSSPLGRYHQPETTMGEYARTLFSFLPSAPFAGRTAAQRAVGTVVPAAATETTGQVVRALAPEYEGAARTITAFGTGGAIGLTRALRHPTPSGPVQRATAGASDANMAQAAQLMKNAEGIGIRLTFAEALDHVTNGRTNLAQIQNFLERSERGRGKLAAVMAERPGQVRGAVSRGLDQIAPATDQPSSIGPQASEAAQTALDRVRQEINARARPHYAALQDQELPAQEYQALARDPSWQLALQEVRANPELNAAIADLPDNNLSVMNEVVKHLDTMAARERPTELNPAGNARLAELRTVARQAATTAAGGVSQDWRLARDIGAQGRAAELAPLQAGPLGTIAGTVDTAAQTRALYPARPLEGAPGETATAIRSINAVNPSVAPSLTRQHIANVYNEAAQDVAGGPNIQGGAKFASQIAGNREQAATLRAGIMELPQGRQTMDYVDRLLEATRATGRRIPTGRGAVDPDELGLYGSNERAVRYMRASGRFNIAQPFREIEEALNRRAIRINSEQLTRMILAKPDEARRLAIALRSAGDTESARALVTAFMQGQTASAAMPPRYELAR